MSESSVGDSSVFVKVDEVKRLKYLEVQQHQHPDVIRKNIIDRAEQVTFSILEQISREKIPSLSYDVTPCTPARKKHLDDNKDDEDDSVRSTSTAHANDNAPVRNKASKGMAKRSTVSYNSVQGKKKIALMLETVQRVYSRTLVKDFTYRTRRSLYYELKDKLNATPLISNQSFIDRGIKSVSALLGCSEWDMGYVASAKGLAAGRLCFNLDDSKKIDFNVKEGGVLISHNIEQASTIEYSAKLVLVVEKDTVFQKLLQERCPERLRCILVTAKGYPDVATRRFVRIMSVDLQLPVYALVDANPFGIDIMCAYRFGTLTQTRHKDQLTCPNLCWLGVLPSEIDGLKLTRSELSSADRAKLQSLKKRSYLSSDIKKELDELEKGKIEIEAIGNYSQEFLTSGYLPLKIKNKFFKR